MSKKRSKRAPKPGAFNRPPASLDAPAPTAPAAAFEAFGAKVTEQIEVIGNTVAKIDERIELIDTRAASLATEQSVADRFAKLEAGEQYAELADRLDKDHDLIKQIDERTARVEAMGGTPSPAERRLGSAFAQELASGEGMKKYRELAEGNKRASVRFKIENAMPFARRHGFAGESSVVIDDGLMSDASDPIVQQGLTELIRDPIGLVDLIFEAPGVVDADTFKEMVEDEESSKGHVVAALNGAITGGSVTAVGAFTVHNTEGFFVGQTVYAWSATSGYEGKHGPHTVSAITPGTTITFATNVVDYDCDDGDLLTGEEFAATAENGIKPAGVLKASLQSVDIQTLATYVILTRQRLRRTNLFDLASWASGRLPVRLREVLEWHLLYGSGTAPQLHGLLNSTQITAHSVSTDTWSTSLEDGGNRADLVLWSAANIPGDRNIVCVMHKLDWFKLANAKDANMNYVHGAGEGPAIINTPTLKAIGGVRVVLSSKIAQTYALVFDPQQASSFCRVPDAEMVVGYVNDQLISNQQTMLYEQSFAHLLKVGTAWRRCYFDAPPTA